MSKKKNRAANPEKQVKPDMPDDIGKVNPPETQDEPEIQDEPKKRRKTRKKKPWWARALVSLFATAVVLAGLAAGGYYGLQYAREYFRQRKYETRSAMVERQMVQCAELCTIKENYADIVTIKKKAVLGLAKSYTIARYKATARAGIQDISAIVATISDDANSVTIELPPAEFLGNEVTSFEIFDDYQNLFVPIETQEVLREIEKSRDEAALMLLEQGILKEADAHAIQIFTAFFQGMGFERVSVRVAR